MTILEIASSSFQDQKPGTSGLRRSTREFRRPGYLENFLQALFEQDPPPPGSCLVVGGDGRTFVPEAARTTARMAVAHGYERVIVGQGGILSTPAVSDLVRRRGAHGGVILSASHNAGGPDGDFGVKYNGRNGGPASTALTDAVYVRTRTIHSYKILDIDQVDIDTLGARTLGAAVLEIVDPVEAYVERMADIFDFAKISALIAGPGFDMRFDAMSAVTGPYARALFEQRLGAPAGTVLRGTPLPDFGGHHPDPHLDYLTILAERVFGLAPFSFAAASDGDGDRNMILGPGLVVSPGDSLAVLAANSDRIPYFQAHPLVGAARSMPTSRALDRVMKSRGLPSFETPTGWKYFCNLLDAGLINLCGEESFGTGSDHIREKDGLWAVLFWLNVLAERNQTVPAVLAEHWRTYGRDYYQRQDYEGLEVPEAEAFMALLEAEAGGLAFESHCGFTVKHGAVLNYDDPVDASRAERQGVQFTLEPDARITYRLSGTGASGATLRVYLEAYVGPEGDHGQEPGKVLEGLSTCSLMLGKIAERLGRSAPSLLT